MAMSVGAATRAAIARGLARRVMRYIASCGEGRRFRADRSVGGPAHVQQRIDPAVLSPSRPLRAWIGHPARAVDDERIAMFAVAKCERDGPSARSAFTGQQRCV